MSFPFVIGWVSAWIMLWLVIAVKAWNQTPRPNDDARICLLVSGIFATCIVGMAIGLVYGVHWAK